MVFVHLWRCTAQDGSWLLINYELQFVLSSLLQAEEFDGRGRKLGHVIIIRQNWLSAYHRQRVINVVYYLRVLTWCEYICMFLGAYVLVSSDFFHAFWQCFLILFPTNFSTLKSLCFSLKDISSKPGKFKIALRKLLQTRSFYSIDEFFDKQWLFLVSIPLSYIFISIYCNIFCVIFTSVLCISVLYLYCLFFKCMGSYTTEPIYWLDTFLYMEFWK